MDYKTLISQRATQIEASGIRKIFDMAANIKNAIDLSIGQPDFDVPAPVQQAAIASIQQGFSRYPPTPGWPELRAGVLDQFQQRHGVRPEDCIITAGTSGALTLSLLAAVNPGDEVLLPDPFFVSYKHLTTMCGGTPVFYNTYPHFQPNLEQIKGLLTPRTKAIMLMSPGNPTGACWPDADKRALAELARARGLLVISDEVYEMFYYGEGLSHSLAEYYPEGTLARPRLWGRHRPADPKPPAARFVHDRVGFLHRDAREAG